MFYLGSKSVGSLSWDETSIRRISIVLDEADIAFDGDRPFGTAEGFALHLRPASDNADTLQIVAEWQAIHMEQALTETLAVLGTDLQPSLMQVELTDAFPAINSSAGLSAWDGRVKIARMLLNWGPAKIGMKGDFGLDGCGRAGRWKSVEVRLDDVPALRSAQCMKRGCWIVRAIAGLERFGRLSFNRMAGFAKSNYSVMMVFTSWIATVIGDLPQGC